MKKKLGPLEAWQWAAIGAAAGLLLLLYNRRRGGAAAAASTGSQTPADAQYDVGPIDPTTGLPFSQEGSGGLTSGGGGGGSDPLGGIVQNAAPMSLADELNDFGLIVGLLSQVQGLTPPPATDTSPASTTDQPAQSTGTQPTSKAEPAPGFHKDRKSKTGRDYYLTGIGWVTKARYDIATGVTKLSKPKTNPGHIVTTKGGKQTARSTAPHTKGQHTTVAPPSHQLHPTTSHPSQPKAHIEHGNAPAAQHPARQNTATKKKTVKSKKRSRG